MLRPGSWSRADLLCRGEGLSQARPQLKPPYTRSQVGVLSRVDLALLCWICLSALDLLGWASLVGLGSPGIKQDSPGVKQDSLGVEQNSPGVEQNSPGVEQYSPEGEQNSPGGKHESPGVEQDSPEIEARVNQKIVDFRAHFWVQIWTQ